MPQYHIWTIGCQMNKADSNTISSYLEEAGYSPVSTAEQADVIVLNSCIVRKSAEDKILNKLASLKALKGIHPDVLIVLTGCLIGSSSNELQQRFPYVDLMFKPQDWETLYDWGERHGVKIPESPPRPTHPPVSTFVAIIQGCNNFCSYCVVPYRRGREKSRSIQEIVCEVHELAEQGVREISLLGQNVDSYGHDLPNHPDLADLLTELNDIENIARIRFLTNHPKDMSHKLIKAVATLDKVCEHLNLPVQAGDDEILRAMRRNYTTEQYMRLVEQIRSNIPNVALSTDVIVGFPGETKEQFGRTADLLREIRFDSVHIAAYSPRPDTIASKELDDDVPPEEKKSRLERLEELQKDTATSINAQLQNKTVEVLVEGKEKGKWKGRTRSDKLVFFPDHTNCLGQLLLVNIEKTSPWALQGHRTIPEYPLLRQSSKH